MARGAEVEREQSAAVDGQVVAAVQARERLAELGVAQHRDGDARKRLAGAGDDPPAHHRGALAINRAGDDARLDGVGAGVQEAVGVAQTGGLTLIERRRHRARVGRQHDAGLHHGLARELRRGRQEEAVGAGDRIGVAESLAWRDGRAEEPGVGQAGHGAGIRRSRCARRPHDHRQVQVVGQAAFQHLGLSGGIEPNHWHTGGGGHDGRHKTGAGDGDVGGSGDGSRAGGGKDPIVRRMGGLRLDRDRGQGAQQQCQTQQQSREQGHRPVAHVHLPAWRTLPVDEFAKAAILSSDATIWQFRGHSQSCSAWRMTIC